MPDIDVIIRIPEDEYKIIKNFKGPMVWAEKLIKDGTPLPKGHGKIVDIGKIDEDRIDGDNPVISLSIGGYCIEAVELDYINSLPAIIEEDKEESE